MRHALFALLSLSFSCAGGTSTTGGDCPAGKVREGGVCVQLCNDDAACDLGICLTGKCEQGKTRPVVTAHTPAAAAIDVLPDKPVVLTFNVPMDEVTTGAAFLLINSQGPVVGEILWNGGRVLTFQPLDPMIGGESYTATLAVTAQSTDAVPIEREVSFQFAIDLPPVVVYAMTPVPGSINVGVLPLMTVEFSVPMDQGSALTNISLIYFTDSTAVQGQITLDTTRTIATFTPGRDLEYGGTYTLTVAAGIQSTAGATLAAEYTGQFSTLATPDLLDPSVSVNAIAGIIAQPDLDTFESYQFTGTATDNESAIEQVLVRAVAAGQNPSDVDWISADYLQPTWSWRWFPLISGGAAPDGSFTLYAKAIDKGGNEASTSTVFAVDFAPPATPTWVTPPPTSWKFKTLQLQVQGDPDTDVEVLLNNVTMVGSPYNLGASGQIGLPIELPVQVSPTIVSVFAVDLLGNRNTTPLNASVARIDYTCLAALNGFPRPGGVVVTGSQTDDEEGNVEVTYRLDSGTAEDTTIDENSPTNNFDGDDRLYISWSRHTLFKYVDDLIPACSGIVSAKLAFNRGSSSTPCGCTGVTVYPLLTNWSATTATWNTPWTTAGGDIDSPAGTFTGAEVDITIIAKEWLDFQNGNPTAKENHGLRFTNINTNLNITSVESFNANYKPRLILSLTEPATD